ncbi:MAG: HAD family hydrolase [Actinomycetota bacterium]
MEAAFFDLDKTILARSSGLALGRNFYREGLISKRLLLRAMAAQIVYLLLGADEGKMEKMREKALNLTKGWEKAKVEQIVEEVVGDTLVPIIYREALELIERHHSEGRDVWIVSSSPEEVVRPMGRLLGADGIMGSRARIDDHGRYMGELDFYCYGESKAAAIRDLAGEKSIDLGGSYAYSDSATDLPMLEAVGHPVATNPDRELRKIAAARGWEVRKFERPVTVRKRIADMAPPRSTVAVTGGVAVSVAALAAYLWLRRRAFQRQPLTWRESILDAIRSSRGGNVARDLARPGIDQFKRLTP